MSAPTPSATATEFENEIKEIEKLYTSKITELNELDMSLRSIEKKIVAGIKDRVNSSSIDPREINLPETFEELDNYKEKISTSLAQALGTLQKLSGMRNNYYVSIINHQNNSIKELQSKINKYETAAASMVRNDNL
jgi:hypothetical protein